MIRRRTDRELADYAQTDWRRLAAWALGLGSVAAALFLGFTGTQKAGKVERRVVVIERRIQGDCVRLEKGKRKGQPSAGCTRLLILLNEACLSHPRACTGSGAVAIDVTVQRALLRAIRQQQQARARARERRLRRERTGRTPNGKSPRPEARVPLPPGIPQPPSVSPQPPPPGGGSTPPPSQGQPPRPPGEIVRGVLADPQGFLREPLPTVEETVCSLDPNCTTVPRSSTSR